MMCAMRLKSLRHIVSAWAVIMTVLHGCPVKAQHVSESAQLTTEERLETEAWWPTKSSLPLSAFAGSAACIGCHKEEAGVQPSSMVRAATPAADSRFLPPGTRARFDAHSLAYYLTAGMTGGLSLTTSAAPSATQKIDWVMGDGVLGRTFLYHADGRWFQSDVTYYTTDHALDVTTGLSHDPHSNTGAVGQVLTAEETRRCFSCHTVHATTSAGFNPLHAEAGLGCEACHGPGQAHVSTARATGAPSPTLRSAIFNPAKLSPADSIDFCGSCHRTSSDAAIAMGGTTSVAAVRFQPYRLQESKCWRATEDDRLTCVACHNPHQALNRDPTAYDRKCVSCHGALPAGSPAEHVAAAVCPRATSRCTACHMPKVNVPSMHGDFTDHDIRIVRPGETMPS